MFSFMLFRKKRSCFVAHVSAKLSSLVHNLGMNRLHHGVREPTVFVESIKGVLGVEGGGGEGIEEQYGGRDEAWMEEKEADCESQRPLQVGDTELTVCRGGILEWASGNGE